MFGVMTVSFSSASHQDFLSWFGKVLQTVLNRFKNRLATNVNRLVAQLLYHMTHLSKVAQKTVQSTSKVNRMLFQMPSWFRNKQQSDTVFPRANAYYHRHCYDCAVQSASVPRLELKTLFALSVQLRQIQPWNIN